MRTVGLLWIFLGTLCAAEQSGITIRPESGRVYGNAEVRLDLDVRGQPAELRWVTSAYGARVADGRAKKNGAQPWALALKTPPVRVPTDLEIEVADVQGERVVSHGTATLRIYPPYDWGRLRIANQNGKPVGVAETGKALATAFTRAGAGHTDVSGRLALETFSGDVLVLDGRWLAERAAELSDTLKARLRAGARILVLRSPTALSSLSVPVLMAAQSDVAVDDPQHPAAAQHALFARWPRVGELDWSAPSVVSCAGNFKTILSSPGAHDVVDNTRDGRHFVAQFTALAQAWPAEGGSVLLVACPVSEQLETNPAAPLVLELCLSSLLADAPAWRPACLEAQLPDEHRALLTHLGVRATLLQEQKPPEARDAMVFLAGAAPPPRWLMEWVRAGGRATVLFAGAGGEHPEVAAKDKAVCGVHASLLEQLAAPATDDTAWRAPHWSENRKSIISGLCDRIEAGNGFLCLLRVGPPDKPPSAAWRRFLSIVLTNLCVRLQPAGEKGE
ncbi:MAG: hypothetical protein NTW87_07705 [Planctomycetota bacterium]|nr:hypothetical protein [Planctomycetota bacterium]